MSKMIAILNYIYKFYPKSAHRLNPMRTIKIFYLIDWRSSIVDNRQLSGIKWKIENLEPIIDRNSLAKLVSFSFNRKALLNRFLVNIYPNLSIREKEIINFVIDSVSKKSDKELEQLVISTYPSITQKDTVDLPSLAVKYREESERAAIV
jgi:hypothetical protein